MTMKHHAIDQLSKFILVLFLVCSEIHRFPSCSAAADHEVICKDAEREALLTLKQGLTDMSPDSAANFSSWGDAKDNLECCDWFGVECSNTTGHVTGLHLQWLTGQISPALLELRHLNSLDLIYNDFGLNKIPEFIGSLEKLEYLSLPYNNFSGDVPYQLGNLTNLKELYLSMNYLTSKDLTWLSNLSSLSKLDLSYNWFSGTFPLLTNLTSLSWLDLSKNRFEGRISSLTMLSSLRHLSVRSNKVTGELPTSIGKLQYLELLDVSYNSLQGTISDVHFLNLYNLTYLDLSFNSLALNFTDPNWLPPFQLDHIRLGGCDMGSHFPSWLQTQRNVSLLDLSSTGLSEEVPDWLWDRAFSLNLSYNRISGSIPNLSIRSPIEIDISSNKFSGPLPIFHPESTQILLSKNMLTGSMESLCRTPYGQLKLLDLSNNQLSGELPNCWENMTKLVILNLADNKFAGYLPHSLGSLLQLGAFHFRNNNFSGELPSTLKNCTRLQFIDGRENRLTGHVPAWIGTLKWIQFLSLRDNKFYGRIPLQICHLSFLKVLDLAENNMSGIIPPCFNNFTSLVLNEPAETAPSMDVEFYRGVHLVHGSSTYYNPNPDWSYINEAIVQWKRQESTYKGTLELLKLIDLSSNNFVGNIPREFYHLRRLVSLNLSRNYLTGDINPDIDQMKMLESLDLSHNKLSGVIPTGLAELHLLSVLDLSSNNLSGKIPKGTQLQSFNPSAYVENEELCGPPLLNCPEDDDSSLPPNFTPGHQGDIDGEQEDMGLNLVELLSEEYFIPVILGFIVGFWGFAGPLLFKRSWIDAYYGFLSKIGDWLYVRLSLHTTWLMRTGYTDRMFILGEPGE